ncbi:hypothetical protein HP550_20775 [Cellulomonas humilata]|uniref:DUF1269 domain-containing family protein n=1 Tax=Cellulomonas humilata TaxID=144055 RepID=A0A7Y6A716_9CELL|nr:DUF6325 family protein [Cellulomonas humilata]NUU19684.1 hypothetical protein [Cellulomonas humilata]
MSDAAGRRPVDDAPDADLVEYLVVAVPDLEALDRLVPALRELVEASAIRIIDLVCVTRSAQGGGLTVLELEDVDSLAGLRDVEGEVGGLLSAHDIATAALAVGPGSSAVVLLVEGCWAARLSMAAKLAGGRIVGGERIARRRVQTALESHTSSPGTQW